MQEDVERSRPTPRKKPQGGRGLPAARPRCPMPDWDWVDEAGWESFPASDPPAIAPARARTGTAAAGAHRDSSTVLDPAEAGALREALDDEYRAWAICDRVVRDFGPERPFVNIRAAEARHIEALRTLFRRYGLAVPESAWPGRVPRYANLREACAAGVEAATENGALYARLLRSSRRPDILAVFRNLQRASERHLPAFRRCLGRDRG